MRNESPNKKKEKKLVYIKVICRMKIPIKKKRKKKRMVDNNKERKGDFVTLKREGKNE